MQFDGASFVFSESNLEQRKQLIRNAAVPTLQSKSASHNIRQSRKRRQTRSVMRGCFLASLSLRGGIIQLPLLSWSPATALSQQQVRPVQGSFHQQQSGRYFRDGLEVHVTRRLSSRFNNIPGRAKRPPLQSLFSTSPKDDAPNRGTTTNVVLRRRVCILKKDEGKNSDNRYDAIYETLADSLSLPILTQSQLMSLAASEEINTDDSDDDTTGHPQRLTHALCLVDYLKGSEDDELPSNQQYALAIQPLIPLDETSHPKKKRNHRRSSKRDNQTKSLQKALQIKPHWIDLCPRTPNPRSGQPDLLLQALAPQRIQGGAVLYDLTAGWAQDSLLLATTRGVSQVVMVERDPIVACMLQDALRRVTCIAQLLLPTTSTGAWKQRAVTLQDKLHLCVGDARDILQNLLLCPTTDQQQQLPRPDIIYLDPMFPPRTKTAAVKKGMQILHGLFLPLDDGSTTDVDDTKPQDTEEADLLQLAYRATNVKVVVKRPIQAATLGGDHCHLKPSHVVEGSINRWDIYVK